jgi:hypothetical protein
VLCVRIRALAATALRTIAAMIADPRTMLNVKALTPSMLKPSRRMAGTLVK